MQLRLTDCLDCLRLSGRNAGIFTSLSLPSVRRRSPQRAELRYIVIGALGRVGRTERYFFYGFFSQSGGIDLKL